ncbi:MAG: hypothetical protein U1F43_14130 [Myxococcota bacterium]
MSSRILGALPLATLAALGACDSTASVPTSALKLPIDFAWGCEGDGQTQLDQNDESAKAINDTRMCPDVGGAQGELFGVALDRQPAGLVVLQLNPAVGDRGFIDADFFRPGTSAIPVGEQPIQVLSNNQHSAFFVLSAGDQRVDRVVIEGHDAGGLHFTTEQIALPGVPASGVIVGDKLVVAARDLPAMWIIPTDVTGSPTVTAVDVRKLDPDKGTVPAHLLHMETIPGDSDAIVATFRDRPTVARLGLDGLITAEAGVVAACRDGLDNDGDGKVDALDENCANFEDDDESDATGYPIAKTAPVAAPTSATACSDLVDNDGDGKTDGDDAACKVNDAGVIVGELAPECNDGIDNDGDGVTDFAFGPDAGGKVVITGDTSCYSEFGNFEGQRPDDGPFDPTFVDAGAAGRFVYVLDERIGQILVFSYAVDGTFARVDVNKTESHVPDLVSVPFGDPTGEVTTNAAIPVVRPPALARQNVKNIEITDGNAFSLSSSRLRGELWDRIINPETSGGRPTVSLAPNDAEWKPTRCSPDNTTACEQPLHDDETWFLFGANLDGRLQLIEAVRRGVPAHRLAQRVIDPSKRTLSVTAPKLTLRGRLINARGEPQQGFPFIGAAIEELLVEEVASVSPPSLRRFGIWPPQNPEEAPTESWALTFEGRIPGASGNLGELVGGLSTTLVDPEATFCEDGVEVGDWVQITTPIAATDAALIKPPEVKLANGNVCPTVEAKTAIIEVRVTGVGQDELVIDPTTARLRPTLPVLDVQKIEADRLVSRRACEQAVKDLDDVLGRPENLTATTAFTADAIEKRFAYNVRVADAWTLVGTRSGFLHRWKWDAAGARCVEDPTLDANVFRGRVHERADAVASYDECPPPADQLSYDKVEELAPAASRFTNPSMGVDVFPGCERTTEGAIAAVPSQQDTTFTFTLTGPQQGSALSISNSVLVTRVPMLDFRRQQVQLDASARRATILQMRLADPKVIATFE